MTLPGSFVSALFWTIPVLFGFGILYVASWTMEISAERNLCFRERLSQ